MTYPGTTREIRFGDAVQIIDPRVPKHYLVGRISAQTTRSENEFFIRFGNGDELVFTTDQFQWVGSPKPVADDQQKLRSQIRSRERMD